MAKEGESREQDGKRGRPDEKPEHRVVSLSGHDGGQKQESQCESKGAHVVSTPVGPFQGGGISLWILRNTT